MCFSANASFIAGATISAIGVVTLKKVKAPSQIVFASIPLIFGVQQLSEGVLWLTIPCLCRIATICHLYFFIFRASCLATVGSTCHIFIRV